MTAPLNPKVKSDPLLYWRTAAFVLCVLIFVGATGYVLDRNHQTEKSIYTACILQNNQIIQSQSGRPAYLILVREILKTADSQGRPQVRADFNEQAKKLTTINLANCRDISKNPEGIPIKKLTPLPDSRVRVDP